ncbi:hypothetical protein RFI_30160 [Reticulomyxa filosa]|uniref:Ssl1-like domain-containing protein n=1 Tax=Reticulomyxa filosa TaxID=46433 RepID=X6LZ72_RETFI|nr:hypothetical protein RFI_30160 [Reticulomyxa filosa]|eukprot:ETO07233.1 hypothetical protein RFI_30160 [Reticulomyxa filosa]
MQIPIHGSREILVLYVCIYNLINNPYIKLITGSLSTVDPDDIFYTIKSLKQYKISVHILSLSAELNILKMVSEATNGDFNVILDEQHFKECLLAEVRAKEKGSPGIKKKMSDKSGIELQDATFHKALRLTRYDQDKTIMFTPPMESVNSWHTASTKSPCHSLFNTKSMKDEETVSSTILRLIQI